MELRKDPITRSWVVIRDGEPVEPSLDPCPYCPGQEGLTARTLLSLPSSDGWQVRVFPDLDPLFRIEGEPARAAQGIYDKMRAIGAHETVVELREHARRLSQASDEEIARVLEAYALRLVDLKKDERFKYISVFKNAGGLAGQRIPHAHSQVVATPFVPRRVLHELRSAREYMQLKERCLFCDILHQELREEVRVVERSDNYIVFCPFSSRTPYEIWLLPRHHHHCFETQFLHSATGGELARILRHTLERVEKLSEGYHYVLHSAPNAFGALQRVGFWGSLEEDFHWHLELMPILNRRPRPYLAKEVYFTTVPPERAARELRQFTVQE
jgi:UDPglucose--hexose-1-phosphate uridylyltransferase